ncbi:MAG: hypothetical protein K1X82_01025 [Bacteroidia bacterium]|nr:hypothetical protein [Bacteroidia bacterium]
MKSKGFSLFVLVVLALGFTFWIGCEAPVSFVEPQPQGEPDLPEFPKVLRGNYLSEDQASVLTIGSTVMYRTYDYDEVLAPDSLNASTGKDTVMRIKAGGFELTSTRKDSTLNHVHYVDTLVVLSENQVLRKLKGYYFISTLLETDTWEVNMLELSRGNLSLGSISSRRELEELKEFAATPGDTAPVRVKLTRKQFKDFVKKDGFSYGETFKKIRL